MRTADNFTGHAVPGYDAPECVLVRTGRGGAEAVQAEVKAKGLSLKVYDCYRPARAVKPSSTGRSCPTMRRRRQSTIRRLPKSALFPRLYRARLGPFPWRHHGPHHSCRSSEAVPPSAPSARAMACTAARRQRAPDTSLDMGTAFDCFDVKANTEVPGLHAGAAANREMLVDVMQPPRLQELRQGMVALHAARTSPSQARSSISRSSRRGRNRAKDKRGNYSSR